MMFNSYIKRTHFKLADLIKRFGIILLKEWAKIRNTDWDNEESIFKKRYDLMIKKAAYFDKYTDPIELEHFIRIARM